MARKHRKKNIGTFILSFVDVLSSAVGALIFLTIVVAMNATGKEKVIEEIKKVDAYVIGLENDVEKEKFLNKELKKEIGEIETELDKIINKIEQEGKVVHGFNDKLKKLKSKKIREVFYKNPIVRKTDKTALYFECRNDQIAFINIESVFDELKSYMESINWSSEPDSTYDIDGFFYIKNYEVAVVIEIYSDSGYVYWRPYKFKFTPTDGWGESCDNIDNINNLHSNFIDTVNKINTYKQFVSFFVRQDSFDIFRSARDILWGKNNIDLNWVPLEQIEDVVINFTTDKDFRNDVQF